LTYRLKKKKKYTFGARADRDAGKGGFARQKEKIVRGPREEAGKRDKNLGVQYHQGKKGKGKPKKKQSFLKRKGVKKKERTIKDRGK